jgi:AcrR family transcriptional regulator
MDQIAGAGPAKALVYQSATIHERRRRILHEARVMIAELGYENFSIRELAKRANVAQRTLYNAFGSRENIVISAIYQYSQEFADHATYIHNSHTLLGRMERLVKVHSRNLQIRPYTTAVMAIYNSTFSDPSIRQAIRKLSNDGSLPFADHLAACRMLAAGVTPQEYAETLTRLLYCTLSSWCVSEIADEAMLESMVETFLMVTFSSTRGAIKKDATKWLTFVRTRSPEWAGLRSSAAVPGSPRRAVRRTVRKAEARLGPGSTGVLESP